MAADLMFKEDLMLFFYFFLQIAIIFMRHDLSNSRLLDLYMSVLLQYNEENKKIQQVSEGKFTHSGRLFFFSVLRS